MLAAIAFFLLMLMPPADAAAQQQQEPQKFTPVEGATLQARQDAAARAASSAAQAQYWTAYSFDVRPGVATDFDYYGDDGTRINIEGSSVFAFDPKLETRNLGVFVLRAGDGAGGVRRVEVYNLARRREYGGYPVYWAGRASNEESLNYLRGLAETLRSEDVAAAAVRALALHDDRRVSSMLEALARNATSTRVRAQSVRWLGHTSVDVSPAPPLIAEFARREGEHSEVRRSAVGALGQRKDAESLSVLQSLYDTLAERDLKRSVLSAIAHNDNKSAAAAFVVRVTERETDKDLRRAAVMHLGAMAGEQALGALAGKATQTDADTELQREAVRAIARRPAAEAVPLLIRIARTHAKPEVRKEAFHVLGRTNDPAAISFLREVVLK